MKKNAVLSFLAAILVVVSILYKVRRGVDHLSGDEPTASSTPAASLPPPPAHTAPAASTPAPAPAPAATAPPSSVSNVIQATDAALERIRNDPKLSPLERRQRETELSQMRLQMMQSEAALAGFRKHQAEQAAAVAPASAPAAAAPASVEASAPAAAPASVEASAPAAATPASAEASAPAAATPASAEASAPAAAAPASVEASAPAAATPASAEASAPAAAPPAMLTASSSTSAPSGILELDSKPGGAEVFVDGKKKGITPETEGKVLKMELAEGDHEVLIRKEGQGSTTQKVFIGGGVTQPLTLTIRAAGFTNSLGMKFVPVPGTQVMMCIHETRNRDYVKFAWDNKERDRSWMSVQDTFKSAYVSKNVTELPVMQVCWDDATAFCAWLSRKEGIVYRLPTDHEWSCAVGIGHLENPRDTPENKDGKVPGFPWGADYPPPRNSVGNYFDLTGDPQGKVTDLDSYNDGVEHLAAVMSYPPNKLGIYDLGGNVWEWCQDAFSPNEPIPVLRGGSWDHSDRNNLASSRRRKCDPKTRFMYADGFRCVIVLAPTKPE